MAKTIREMKLELKEISSEINARVEKLFGDQAEEIDFSFIDLCAVLIHSELKHKAEKPNWSGRDRIVISNLHVIPSYLATLAGLGFIEWNQFGDMMRQLPRIFSNPNLSVISYPGIEFITADPYLGMIHSLGYACAGRNSRHSFRVYHILTEDRTAALQNSLMAASGAGTDNLICLIPRMNERKRPAIQHFWFSMGWHLEEVRFNDISSIFDGLQRKEKYQGKPSIIL